MVVDSVVRSGAPDVGRRARRQGDALLHARLAVWYRVLFRHLLVADLRTDPLRRRPVAARLSFDLCRVLAVRTFSRTLCRDTRPAPTTLWKLGIPRRSIRLGLY